MSYHNIYGTGGVVFQDLINVGEYIYFPNAIAKIEKKRIYKRTVQNKGRILTKHKGWRLYHTITIQNYRDNDYINILKLLSNISYMTNQSGLDKPMYYYPKVNSFYEGFEANYSSYRIIADGMTIKFNKIADSISQGEILTITFMSIGLENNLSIYSQLISDNIVTDTGDNIITNTGDNIIIQRES